MEDIEEVEVVEGVVVLVVVGQAEIRMPMPVVEVEVELVREVTVAQALLGEMV